MLPGPAGLTGLAGGVSEGPGLGAGSGLRGAPWAGGRAKKVFFCKGFNLNSRFGAKWPVFFGGA